MKPAL